MKKCIWCLKTEPEVSFKKKAHTIPKSLGGQNYYSNVCDSCNSFFGNKEETYYSIEEALKEAFNISRKRFLLNDKNVKRKVGKFKSRFFDIKKQPNATYKLKVKSTFKLKPGFQKDLAFYFKRGLYKMYFEELCRQESIDYEDTKYNFIRNFARYGVGNPNVYYFYRSVGLIATFSREAETPVLYFNRMKYLFSNKKFVEIEFLGHVFGFPTVEVSNFDYFNYLNQTEQSKTKFFSHCKAIDLMVDMDIALTILND